MQNWKKLFRTHDLVEAKKKRESPLREDIPEKKKKGKGATII